MVMCDAQLNQLRDERKQWNDFRVVSPLCNIGLNQFEK
jgi:hypothetical protein